MKKEIKIEVNIIDNFEIELYPDEKNWNDARSDEKDEYIRTQINEYIVENIDDIIIKYKTSIKPLKHI